MDVFTLLPPVLLKKHYKSLLPPQVVMDVLIQVNVTDGKTKQSFLERIKMS